MVYHDRLSRINRPSCLRIKPTWHSSTKMTQLQRIPMLSHYSLFQGWRAASNAIAFDEEIVGDSKFYIRPIDVSIMPDSTRAKKGDESTIRSISQNPGRIEQIEMFHVLETFCTRDKNSVRFFLPQRSSCVESVRTHQHVCCGFVATTKLCASLSCIVTWHHSWRKPPVETCQRKASGYDGAKIIARRELRDICVRYEPLHCI